MSVRGQPFCQSCRFCKRSEKKVAHEKKLLMEIDFLSKQRQEMEKNGHLAA